MDHNESRERGEPERAPAPPEDRESQDPADRDAVADVRRRERTRGPSATPAGSGALAFMAHELRTPLSAIIGIADLLRDSQLSADQRDLLDIMGRSARALVEIVNGVLDLEKLQAGKLQLEKTTFSPGDCVEECVSLMAASVARKRIDLAFSIDESVPSLIQGDEVRLRQTLLNLLGNALKFTDAGQVVVTVTATPWADGRCELRFAVADSGPGIAAEHQGAIFEPYAQADPSTSRRFGGTGLGLPITRQLVTLMGGRLWIESEVGKGSTFRFTLPAEFDAQAGVRAPSASVDLAGRRVLVVEDNPVVGELLVSTLGRWGADAALATDLPGAMTALQDGTFSLALVDGEMPGLTGRAVALAIRSVAAQRDLPLVLMTQLGAPAEVADASDESRDARFSTLVTKPVRPARLRDAVAYALAAPPPSGVVAAPGDPSPPGTRAPERRLSGIRVLVADDDPGVRAVLQRSLSNAGAEVMTVEDGARALAAAVEWKPDTMLVDASMPGMDGFELCRRLKADRATRLVPVIIVTGLDSAEDRGRVLGAGADGIIPKPFDREELFARVRSSARMKQVTDHLQRADELLVLMARSIEGNDPYTLGHCERLSDYSARLAARLGMDEAEIAALRLSGLVHDIGKVSLPEELVKKPGALDERERDVMRSHPIEGERLCSSAPTFGPVLPIIRHHHERMDGSGYPDGLAGHDIPKAARVLQVVDVYDALTTARPYRRAESPEGALRIIESEVARGWWDPTIFAAFRDLVHEDLYARRAVRSHRH